MLKKVRNKIIFSFSGLIMLITLALFVFFNNLIRNTHLNIIKREMSEKLRFISLVYKNNLQNHNNNQQLLLEVKKISETVHLRVTVISLKNNVKGVVIADSDVKQFVKMDNHFYRKEIQKSLRMEIGQSVRFSNTLKTYMLYSAIRHGDIIIRLAKPLFEIDESLWKLKKLILMVSGVVIMLSFIIIAIISNKITRPIDETLNFAKQFATGNYSKRILNYSDDEIGAVQRALNKMADTIVEKIDNLIFEQNKLSITLESIIEGIAVIDNDKKIILTNESFNKIFEMNDFKTGKSYFEIIRSRSLNNKIELSLHIGQSDYFEEKMLNGNYYNIYINPIKDARTIHGILLVMQDITEKKKIEQMKADLVGNMSHELKTPITILKGYLETIKEQLHKDDSCYDYINKAIANADRQNSLINDILKLHMLDTTKEYMEEDVELYDIICNIIEILKPKIIAKQISVELNLDSLPRIIKSNRFMVEEVFFNIIDNALNYNQQSGTVAITSDAPPTGSIAISITDTGIGIPEKSIDRIFERFYRVDKSRSRSTGGTGLGLSIVKHAIELLGWSISVESGKGGTRFSVGIK